MRILILTLSVALFFLSFVSAENKNSEDIQDPYIWDFGKVKQGHVLEHIFVLKNDLHNTLHIESIYTPCDCTTSEVEKKDIPPGDKAEIKVKFDTEGYSGKREKHVYVRTGQKDNPTIRLIIKADIQPTSPPDNN